MVPQAIISESISPVIRTFIKKNRGTMLFMPQMMCDRTATLHSCRCAAPLTQTRHPAPITAANIDNNQE